MALNFADAASKKLADIEKPPLPPQGTYRWKIMKLPTTTTSPDDKWDFVKYPVRAMEAIDADLTDYKGDTKNIVNSVDFIFDKEDEVSFEKSLYNHKRFLSDHVKCADEKMTNAQAMNAAVGQEFLGTLTWKEDKKNPGEWNANITRTAPLDD